MTIESWVYYTLAASLLAALMPLIQERYQADGFALAYGSKLVVALVALPFVIQQGLPQNPAFYAGLAMLSSIWCINDVHYFNAIGKVGAGVISRLLPSASIISFVLWFIVRPGLFEQYLQTPLRSLGIVACVLSAVWFTTHLTRCQVTKRAIRLLWFVLLAAAIGPIATKLILDSASIGKQAPAAYVFAEALFMLGWWTIYACARPRTALARTNWQSVTLIKAALAVGLVSSFRLILENTATMEVDHPSYVTIVMYVEVLWILLIYKLVGRKDESNITAGLGLVACAAALVILKSLG